MYAILVDEREVSIIQHANPSLVVGGYSGNPKIHHYLLGFIGLRRANEKCLIEIAKLAFNLASYL